MSRAETSSPTILHLGIVLTLVGAVATLMTLLPLATGGEPFPVVFYLLAMLAPLGLGLILVGFWQRARARRHDVAAPPP